MAPATLLRRPALREATCTIRTGEDGLPTTVTVELRSHGAEGTNVGSPFSSERSIRFDLARLLRGDT